MLIVVFFIFYVTVFQLKVIIFLISFLLQDHNF